MISILLFTKYGDNIFLIRKKRDGDHILMLIYRTMGILSSSKIFTKHGDKMIFIIPILSPFKNYDNGDKMIFKITILSPFKNMTMGIMSQSKIFIKHGDKMIFKITILSPFKKHSNEDLVSIIDIY